jgi:hypothetical protein
MASMQDLPLGDLIGGPLVAMVEAEALAAQTTAEYIERVGFAPPRASSTDPGAEPEDSGIGELRMAHFGYEKQDESGNQRRFEVRVPVISLVPIPGVRIKSARIAFTARILDARAPEEDRRSAPANPRATTAQPLRRLGDTRTLPRLRGGFSPRRSAGDGTQRGSFEIDIQVNVEQMPIAPGLEKLLMVLDQAIREESTPEVAPRGAER